MVPNLGPPDVLGLQFPEAFAATSAGQDFWELTSKNIWRPKVGDHSCRASFKNSPLAELGAAEGVVPHQVEGALKRVSKSLPNSLGKQLDTHRGN